MNARQAAEINQEKTEDLLNSSIEMAKKNNISVLDAIDKKVQVYQRYSKNATESTAWQLRGDNAKEIYLKQENNINQEQTNKSIDYSKIWNETKFVDREDPILSDELTINDELFKNAINVINKFNEEPDLLKEISTNAWNNYVKNELDYPPVEPDFSEVVAEYDVDMDYAEQVWEATLEDFKDEMEAYEKKWKLSDRNSFIQEKYSNEVEVLQKFYTTNYDLAEKRLEFIENILKELGKENNIELKNISIAKQENTQPTNIRLGDKFIFDNKPYEVYHIREQHDPKIYLEHTAEDGIRDELTYYQSDIVKALKENKIEMIDKRELIENEVTNHDIIKMWADKPEQEQNKEFNLSEFLADVKTNFSAEEKAYLRERLLINFRQNEFSPITFQKNSNISKEGIEKVENFYNKFKQENYTPVSEKDLKEYGFNYASIYVDKNFENKVDDILKAMHYDEDIRTEINEVYLKTKKNINSKQENNMENNVNQEQQKNNQIKDILTDIKNNNSPANNLLRREIELGAEKAFTQIGIENNLFSTKDIDDRVAEISKTQANIEADFGNLDNNQAQEFVKKAHELKNLNSFDFQKPNKQEIQAILDVFKPGETIQSIIDKYKQENSVTPQNLPVDENLQKLQDKVKYLGLGDTQEVRDKIAQIYHGDLGKSQITTTSDKVMKGNKVEFNLNFNKTEKGVFFNSYEAKLTTKQGEERSHTFNVQNNNVTGKEAINLLEGRAVKMNFQKLNQETGEITENQAFIKLKLKDEKTEKGNYKLEGYNVNAHGIDIDKIMEKSNIKGSPQELENVKKHLEKGNIASVTFEHEQKEIKGYAVFNPQWKMLNLYDEKMSRVNSNKQSIEINTEQNQKNNVIQQKNSRSL